MTVFTQTITKEYTADIAVVGGGVAGVSAAVSAAREGKKVILIEQSGILGGQAGFGIVTPLSSTASRSGIAFGGIVEEICTKVRQTALQYCVSEGEPSGSLIAAPPILRYVLLSLCLDSGVNVRFHTSLIGVEKDGRRVTKLIVSEKSGLAAIEAKAFIDADGDGELIYFAGDTFSLGSEPNVLQSLSDSGLDEIHFTQNGDAEHKYQGYGDKREMQPVSLFFTMGGVDYARASALNNKYLTYQTFGLTYDEYAKLPYAGTCGFEQEADGSDTQKLPLPQGRVLMTRGVRRDIAVINMSRVVGIDASNADSLNEGELSAQKQVLYLVDFLKRYVPGFEKAYYIDSAVSLGIRETRRLIGRYVLSGADVIHCRRFDDAIARGSYIIDIHDPKGKAKAVGGEIKGDYYEIPLRSLESRQFDNLFAAGRCISADHVAHSSTRIQGTCILTGQAAGVAAAMYTESGKEPDAVLVRDKLKTDGVWLD